MCERKRSKKRTKDSPTGYNFLIKFWLFIHSKSSACGDSESFSIPKRLFFTLFSMVNVENGKLVTCDPALKQFLLNLDEKREFGGRRFILKGKYRG